MRKFAFIFLGFLFLLLNGLSALGLADAVISNDEIGLKVNPDFSTTLIEDETVRVLTPEGMSRYQEIMRTYWKDTQKLQVKKAGLIYPDGELKELSPEMITEETPANLKDSPLYQDFVIVKLKFPLLKPDSVIKYRFELSNLKPWYQKAFWGLSYIEDYARIEKTLFSLELPDSAAFYWHCGEKLSPQEKVEDGKKLYLWELSQRPSLVQEVYAPPLSEIAQNIQVSSFASWQALGEWALAAVTRRLEKDEAVKSKTGQLLGKAVKEEEKLKRLLDFIKAIPLVELNLAMPWERESGISNLLKAKKLTANDKALLLLALLRSANIPAFPVLGKSRQQPALKQDLASPESFDRLLVALPKGKDFLFLDPGELNPLSGFPSMELQGREGLVLKEGGVAWVKFPYPLAEYNLEEIRAEAFVNAGGNLEEKLQISAFGINQETWATLLGELRPGGGEEEGISRVYQLLASQVANRAKLLDYSPAEILKDKVVLNFAFQSPEFGLKSGKFLIIPQPMLGSRRIAQLLQDSPRIYPLDLQNVSLENKEFTLAFPEEFTVKGVPEDLRVENQVGSFQFISRQEKNRLKVISRFLINLPVVSAQDYPKFKELVVNLLEKEREVILLEKK